MERYLDVIAGHPVFVAYNANVDAMVTVDETVERALEPPEGRASPPLDSPSALSSAIREAMVTGEGNEMRIDAEFGEWLEETIEPGERRLGGQAGIFGNVLSVLGADPVLYTYMLSEIQRSMFQDPSAIRFPVVEDGGLTYRPASEVTNADRTKTNWIFEFAADQAFFETHAVTDTRFIAAARPEQFNLEIGEVDEYSDELAAEVDCALLSGFHSLKAEFADGTTYADHIDSAASFLRKLRANDVTIQVEYAVTHIDPLREAIHEEIVPLTDALGIDTRELGMLAADLGVDVAEDDPDEEDVVAVYEQARAVQEALDVPCLKLHATDYFMSVTDDYLDPDAVRQGFDFASVVAATRATMDGLHSQAELETGAEVPLSVDGQEAVVNLAAALGESLDGSALVTDDVVVHPNRVVDDPESTVGLGDTVSTASFALETGLTTRRSQTPQSNV